MHFTDIQHDNNINTKGQLVVLANVSAVGEVGCEFVRKSIVIAYIINM